jgi:hypothetical protein
MLNLSWLGNCLGIMDIRLLVGRLRRFLLGLGSSASDSEREPVRAVGVFSEPGRALVSSLAGL